jgi:hypothetical protein
MYHFDSFPYGYIRHRQYIQKSVLRLCITLHYRLMYYLHYLMFMFHVQIRSNKHMEHSVQTNDSLYRICVLRFHKYITRPCCSLNTIWTYIIYIICRFSANMIPLSIQKVQQKRGNVITTHISVLVCIYLFCNHRLLHGLHGA